MRIPQAFIFLALASNAWGIDSNFFAHPILQQYLPRANATSPQPTTAPSTNKYETNQLADKIEAIWSQDKERVRQNSNAGWTTDFVTSGKDPKLNQMVYENNLSPEQYKAAVEAWAQKYQRGVIKGPQTLERAGDKSFQAGKMQAEQR